MKRFYTDVTIDAQAIRLDGRPVKTPGRAPLLLPTPALAQAVAEEWRAQGEEIDPRAMPLTGLANAAIDRVAADRDSFVREVAAYAETDLLCYRAEGPEPLVERQAEQWDPLLEWARSRYAVAFVRVAGIMHQPQPPQTVARIGGAVDAFDLFRLTALQQLTTIAGSLVIGLAIAEGRIDARAGFDIAHLDELWQAELWGEDWMATDMRDARRSAFEAAARFMALL